MQFGMATLVESANTAKSANWNSHRRDSLRGVD